MIATSRRRHVCLEQELRDWHGAKVKEGTLIHSGGLPVASFTTAIPLDNSRKTWIMWGEGGASSADRIRFSGYIRRVKVGINRIGTSSTVIKFKVLRPVADAAHYDLVSESETIPVTSLGTQTYTLSRPMACREGDVLGCYIDYAGATVPRIYVNNQSGFAISEFNGDLAGVNQFVPVTLASLRLNLEGYSDPPGVVLTGDDLVCNTWNSHYSDGPSGDTEHNPTHQLGALLGHGDVIQAGNYAKGSQTLAWVASTAIPDIVALSPRCAWLHCGLNDIVASRTWAAVLADLATIRAAAPADVLLYIDEILPWTAASNAQAATIREWNALLAAWCADNNAILVRVHDALAQIRIATGELDDLHSDYDLDDKHLTPSGIDALARIFLRTYSQSRVYVLEPPLFSWGPGVSRSDLDFTRDSIASYVDSSQLLQVAPNGALRQNYIKSPVSGLWEPSILLEGSRTNGPYWDVWSTDMGRGVDVSYDGLLYPVPDYWVGFNTTRLLDGTLGPDGASPAYKFRDNLDVDRAHGCFSRQSFQMTTHTISVFAKSGGHHWLNIDFNNHCTWFDLDNGLTGTVDPIMSPSIAGPYNGSWWRCAVAFTLLGPSEIPVDFFNATGDNDVLRRDGDGVKGLYLACPQWENAGWWLQEDPPFSPAPFPSSFIPGAASLTRAADSVCFPWRFLPSLEISGYLEFIEGGTIQLSGAALWYIGNAGNTGARLYIDSTGTYYRITHHNGASAVTSTLAVAPAIGDKVRLRWRYTPDGKVEISQSINGGAETAAAQSGALAPAAGWSAATQYLNSTGASNHGFVNLQAIRIAAGNRTMAQLQG